MTKVAFVFPGQGSQFSGMGKDFFESSENAKNIFNKFDEVLGRNLSEITFNGSDEDLKKTINTQPAILSMSIAALEAFREKSDIKPVFTAGHSLGEYAALYASEVVSLDDVAKLIQKRAESMDSVKSEGAMSAILGLDELKVKEVIEKAISAGYVDVANYNTPEQIVITGEKNAVEEANKIAAESGAKRVVPLAVSGAFHSKLMKPAADVFVIAVENSAINEAVVPVITNVDAQPTVSSSEFSEKMINQIYSSVYWTQSVNYMIEQGVDTFIEFGPGKVLSGMIKKISRQAKTYNVSDIASLESTIAALEAQSLV